MQFKSWQAFGQNKLKKIHPDPPFSHLSGRVLKIMAIELMIPQWKKRNIIFIMFISQKQDEIIILELVAEIITEGFSKKKNIHNEILIQFNPRI